MDIGQGGCLLSAQNYKVVRFLEKCADSFSSYIKMELFRNSLKHNSPIDSSQRIRRQPAALNLDYIPSRFLASYNSKFLKKCQWHSEISSIFLCNSINNIPSIYNQRNVPFFLFYLFIYLFYVSSWYFKNVNEIPNDNRQHILFTLIFYKEAFPAAIFINIF